MRNTSLLLFVHGKALAKVPVQARRALGVWETVLDFSKAKGWRQGDNPAQWKGCHQYRFPRRRVSDKSVSEISPDMVQAALDKLWAQAHSCSSSLY